MLRQGDFGLNYAHRAYVARTGYQQLVPYITIYPGLNGPAFGPFSLQANQSFLYTFSRKPPILTQLGGFWSLTFYGADQYLIPNPLNIFEVGDRSNITYDDGSLIYGPGSNPNKDGPFRILVQQADLPPPKNWTSNWLPSPAGAGNGSFICKSRVVPEGWWGLYCTNYFEIFSEVVLAVNRFLERTIHLPESRDHPSDPMIKSELGISRQ